MEQVLTLKRRESRYSKNVWWSGKADGVEFDFCDTGIKKYFDYDAGTKVMHVVVNDKPIKDAYKARLVRSNGHIKLWDEGLEKWKGSTIGYFQCDRVIRLIYHALGIVGGEVFYLRLETR
jgi:hypothetical protein